MKILKLCHSDTYGGASRAMYRIFDALLLNGVDVTLLVKKKGSNNEHVIEVSNNGNDIKQLFNLTKTRLENKYYKYQLKKYRVNNDSFISNLSSISILKEVENIQFDILHLHWVSHQFLNLNELLEINKPIVWTLHDCWPFTGICHYFDTCNEYTLNCGTCPILNSNKKNDLSFEIWKKKNRVYKNSRIHVVAPSNWIGQSASKSSLMRNLPISIIPYPIDVDKFKLNNKNESKNDVGLDFKKRYILFGSFNPDKDNRKGLNYFIQSISYLNDINPEVFEILILGTKSPINTSETEIKLKINYIDQVNNDEVMNKIFCSSDVVVSPSISENLSLVIMESLSSGVPVVSFNIGGNSDMIEHKKNGYLAIPYSSADLAKGINWCLTENNKSLLSMNARKKVVDNYLPEKVANSYEEIYRKILNNDE